MTTKSTDCNLDWCRHFFRLEGPYKIDVKHDGGESWLRVLDPDGQIVAMADVWKIRMHLGDAVFASTVRACHFLNTGYARAMRDRKGT